MVEKIAIFVLLVYILFIYFFKNRKIKDLKQKNEGLEDLLAKEKNKNEISQQVHLDRINELEKEKVELKKNLKDERLNNLSGGY